MQEAATVMMYAKRPFLFELVVGREPFSGRTDDYFGYVEALRAGPDLPRGLDPMLYWRGLAPDPADRFENPWFLAAALRATIQ